MSTPPVFVSWWDSADALQNDPFPVIFDSLLQGSGQFIISLELQELIGRDLFDLGTNSHHNKSDIERSVGAGLKGTEFFNSVLEKTSSRHIVSYSASFSNTAI